MMNDWLEDIKVGDWVIVQGGGPMSRGKDTARTVKRLTKTQIVLNGTDTKFKKRNGSSVGSSTYYHSYLRESTPETLKKVKREQMHRNLVYKLSTVKWQDMSLEVLSDIYEAVEGGA